MNYFDTPVLFHVYVAIAIIVAFTLGFYLSLSKIRKLNADNKALNENYDDLVEIEKTNDQQSEEHATYFMHQLHKYGLKNGQFFDAVTGEVIPLDEPLFLIRANDKMAVRSLRYHASTIKDVEQKNSLKDVIEQFTLFLEDKHACTDFPDTTGLEKRVE